MQTVVKKFKENPVVSSIITLGAIAAASLSIVKMMPVVDSWHVTESEMNSAFITHVHNDLNAHTNEVMHEGAQQIINDLNMKIDKNALYDKCTGLRAEIRYVKDAIYEAERDDSNGRRLNDLKKDLDELQEIYQTLSCSAVLS